MTRFAALMATILCGVPATVLYGQQDPGPAIVRLPIQPPSKAAIPPKLDTPYSLLRINVDENGAAKDVHVILSAGKASDAKAVEAVSAGHFPPRVQNGAPVKYGLQLAVTIRPADTAGGEPVAQIHTVKPPIVVFAPEPELTQEARRKHVEGNVLIGIVVDEKGRPQQVHVIRGLGDGLDEKATEAVRKYRFKPATVEEKAISVPMNVEVNFQVF